MGIYINPRTDTDARSKANTITAAAVTSGKSAFLQHKPGADDLWGVCLLDNGFIAAGVAFNENERAEFARDRDNVIGYYLLSLDAIEKMDPGTAKTLREVKAKQG